MDSFRFFRDNFTEYVIIENSTVNFPEHCHTADHVITFIAAGNAELSINGRTQILGSGEYFTVQPYKNHRLVSHGNVTLVTMCISRRLTEQDMDVGVPEKIIRRSLEKFSENISVEDLPENMPEIFLEKALEICSGNIIFGDSREYDPLILRTVQEIESCPENGDGMGHFAQRAYASKFHFIRKFREATGLTPHKFRIQSRVRMAQRLLASGRGIADTALSAGFYDQSHFNKLFKRIVGISPGEYRRSLRNFVQD